MFEKTFYIIFISVILLHWADAQNRLRNVPLKGQCEYDEDCEGEYSYCRLQSVCECKTGFVQIGTTCVVEIGAVCKFQKDCSTLENSYCKENICVCNEEFTSDPSENKCVRYARAGANCTFDEMCRGYLGTLGICFNRVCQCQERYHPALNDTCIRNVGINERCTNSQDCFSGQQNTPESLECRENVCRCKEGFKEKDQICTSGSGSIFYSIYLVTILLFVGKLM